ncbi:MAG TPA: Ig-like domain repeat protein [Streptosporangiaceae bacterium]|jgi:hypothetical protein
MNEKWKWVTARRLRRGAVILGAVGLTASAGLAAAGSALAAVGSGPGQLQLSPASGALTTIPTWSTTTACPTNFQASAQVSEYTTSGTFVSTVSNVVTGVTAPFNGLLLGNVGALLGQAGISTSAPGTLEWVVGCFSGVGGTGNQANVQSIFVTATAAGTYTTSSSGPALTATTTTLAVSPNSGVDTSTPVTLTATVTAADGTSPAGTVTFFNGSTAINSTPVAVTWNGATGTASTSTTFTTPGSFPLTATFTPTPTTYASSTSSTFTLTVTQAGSTNAGGTNPVVINATVAATGTLTVTVAAGPVNLAVSGLVGTGTLPTVTVKDTRNSFPGWSVQGQESNFTSTATPSTPIPGNQLGWAPMAVNSPLPNGAILGGTVAPGTNPGLGSTPQVLALAHAGAGADPSGATSDQVSANLTLDIPPTTTAGAYTGNLLITYLSAQA